MATLTWKQTVGDSPERRRGGSHLAAVLGVDIRHLGAGQVADDDAVAVAVEEGLALGVLV